jgi:hypothetical protein
MGDTRLLRHVVIFFDVFIAICGAQLQSQYRMMSTLKLQSDSESCAIADSTLNCIKITITRLSAVRDCLIMEFLRCCNPHIDPAELNSKFDSCIAW